MAKEDMDLRQLFVPVKLHNSRNTPTSSEEDDPSFDTTDIAYFHSFDEIKNIPAEDRIKSLSDFALSNIAVQDHGNIAQNGKFAGQFSLRTDFSSSARYYVDCDGSTDWDEVESMTIGSSVAMDVDPKSLISAKKTSQHISLTSKKGRNGKEKHFIELGQYPGDVADSETQKLLEDAYNGGNLRNGLTCTGRLYTTNEQKLYGEDFLAKQNPEFEYNGQKYARVIVWNDAINVYSDGSTVKKTGAVVWHKVQPISLEIKNWDKLPRSINPKGKIFGADSVIHTETEECVLAGISFYPNYHDRNCSLWQNSLARAFFNSAKSSELDGNPGYRARLQWDFSNSGFLYQAFDMTREATREYVVPKTEHEIATNAFAGCVGIEKIVIHPDIRKIGKCAFDGCGFDFAYKLKGSEDLVLARDLPKDKEFAFCIQLKDVTKAIKEFDYYTLLDDVRLQKFSEISQTLNKNKIRVPYIFARVLDAWGELETFGQSSGLKFFKSEPDIDLTLKSNFEKLSAEEKLNYYKFMLAIGCFSGEKVLDKNGKETDTLLAQKATSLFAQIMKSGTLKIGQFHGLFNALPMNVKPDQEFLKFLSLQGDKKKFQNLEMLLALESSHRGIFVKAMTNFDQVKTFRTTLDENGKPITVPWKDALMKFYLLGTYTGVTRENRDMAALFAGKGLSQAVFDKANTLRIKAKADGVQEHILGKELREMTILENIEKIKEQTEAMLADGKTLIDELYAKQFTFEMLSKYDPHNAIMGLYCSCCGTITSSFYGKDIARASVEAEDVQNLVVRDSKGEIIAKGTMYVNSELGYAVFNDFEINERYRNHEIDSGRYDVLPDSKEEHERDLIFGALMRGVHAFVEEYDKIHPDKPMQQVNVGMGYNRLKKQCEKYALATKELSVPSEYNFQDATEGQRVLYDREKENSTKGEKNK